MDFTLNSDIFLANLNANNLKTPTKQQKLPLAQLIMSSSDMLESQIIMRPSQRMILKFKKRRAVASPDKWDEKLANSHETFKTHETDTTSSEKHETSRKTSCQNSETSQNSDEMLQNARKLLKQALQQATSFTVQRELETSIKALDQARQNADLRSLKQSDEAFQSKSEPNVQEQLDNFKGEVNIKLNAILHTMSQKQSVEKPTSTPTFVFGQSSKTHTKLKGGTQHHRTTTRSANKVLNSANSSPHSLL